MTLDFLFLIHLDDCSAFFGFGFCGILELVQICGVVEQLGKVNIYHHSSDVYKVNATLNPIF